MGRQEFSTDGGEATRRLIEQKKKSAAVETVFTWGLMTFGFWQVSGSVFNIGSVEINTSFEVFALLVYSAVMLFSIVLGGENVVEVFRKETRYFDDRWEYN